MYGYVLRKKGGDVAEEKKQSDIRQLDETDIRQVGGMGLSEPDEGPESEPRPWEPPKPELGPNEKPIESTLSEAEDTHRDPSDAAPGAET
jgi:hypothetical protein